ncbi:MAG: SAM-dependent methyltransferase [Candidatus Odinarchaeota archaeon]
MGKWKRTEAYRKRAREAGYRSRAAYKLLEIEEQFSIFKHAKRIVDFCSAPGSWLQVIKECCKTPDCSIVGIDINYIKPLSGVHLIQSSIDDPRLKSQILELIQKPANLVLSDCSPKLTGKKTIDRERQIWQAKMSLQLALQLLEKNGHFVTKVFQSGEFRDFITHVKQHFSFVKTFKPKSSFQRSSEMYLIAKHFQGKQNPISQDAL